MMIASALFFQGRIWQHGDQDSARALLQISLAAVCGLLILAGLLTPVVGIVSALGAASIAIADFSRAASAPAIMTSLVSVAVVLLGPGAWSLDAKLFGPREILIPPRRQAER
ncbi:MAG: hypothetical protein KGN84_05270 [Acidobacteriota bacterium]|nr:hypothetical protein [Acidobacteriota bacterium]